jgi:hypothetical protein
VVYDDLPPIAGERPPLWEERLACPREQTLLITTEPSTIKVYGKGYLNQFGHVLTSQEPWAVPHPRPIFSQPALIWFYGRAPVTASYDHIAGNPPETKSATISTVCSSKQQKHTLHHHRVRFVRQLKEAMPQLEVFGHGVRPIADKSEALDPFRYHVAIENHVYRHHWTEKLADSFLGLCLPFYHGCPNVFDYFPEESIVPINIHNFDEAQETIARTIRDRAYEKRLPALHEARRLILEEFSLFPCLSRLIEERTPLKAGAAAGDAGVILSRHAWRRKSPWHAISFGAEKARIALKHALSRGDPA